MNWTCGYMSMRLSEANSAGDVQRFGSVVSQALQIGVIRDSL